MQESRATTLEALSAYIASQRVLLSQTQSDIELLRDLRARAVEEPDAVLENIHEELDDGAFRLSKRLEQQAGLPEDLDWTLFERADPAPLHELARTTRNAHARRYQPFSTQQSAPSELQRLVRDARKTIVDPVLEKYKGFMEEAEAEAEARQLQQEAELVQQALGKKKKEDCRRKRSGRCGLTISNHRARGPGGLFVRRTSPDEAGDVDVMGLDGQSNRSSSVTVGAVGSNTPSLPPQVPLALSKAARNRRPSMRMRDSMSVTSSSSGPSRRTRTPRTASPQLKHEPPPSPSPSTSTLVTTDPPPPKHEKEKKTKSGKPKTETFNQTWSTSEQLLLERLLEEYPDGVSQRWKKISVAMNSTRTPRQVASRVQKYFAKLKRFGIAPEDITQAGAGRQMPD